MFAEVCGTRRNQPRHKEAWWWNDEKAKTMANKTQMFKTWQKSRTCQDKELCCKAKQVCKKIITAVNRTKNQKLEDEVNAVESRRNVFRNQSKTKAKVGQEF